MSRIRFDVVCKCPHCGERFTSCNSNYECRRCGANIKDVVDSSIASVNGATLLIPVLITIILALRFVV